MGFPQVVQREIITYQLGMQIHAFENVLISIGIYTIENIA